MSKIKIAFFDIDGTMIDMKTKQITDKMIETLQLLQKNGIIICIATGRPPMSVPHFPNVEFDAFLTFNASYCYTKEDIIFKNPIPNWDVMKVVENAKHIQRPVVIAGADRMRSNGKDEDMTEYFATSKQEVPTTDGFEELAKEDVYQVMLGCYKEEHEALMKDADQAKITAWWDRGADIIPANGGKGIGVEKILEYYHLSKEEAIAFGDGSNDIEMLQAVGTGVAMGNATEDVKEIADVVCGTAIEDGIYYYCKEQYLI